MLNGIPPALLRGTGGVLTVNGSRKHKDETGRRTQEPDRETDREAKPGSEPRSEPGKNDFYCREIRYESFARSISLPDGVRADDLKADYCDGILELITTMTKEPAPREV
jgi:Hsp20/alpha crystallin family protein